MNQTLKPLPKAIIRLKLAANKAAPSPVLGQSLGQYGINIMDFCKKYEELCIIKYPDAPLPLEILESIN